MSDHELEMEARHNEIAALRTQIYVLRQALQLAVSAGTYVVNLCEANTRAGVSPSPFEKADWHGTVAHCYAAMNFLDIARKVLKQTETKGNNDTNTAKSRSNQVPA